jgi:hypothetical protein
MLKAVAILLQIVCHVLNLVPGWQVLWSARLGEGLFLCVNVLCYFRVITFCVWCFCCFMWVIVDGSDVCRSAVHDEQQRNIISTSSSRRFRCGRLQLVLGNAVPGQLWAPRWVSDSYDTSLGRLIVICDVVRNAVLTNVVCTWYIVLMNENIIVLLCCKQSSINVDWTDSEFIFDLICLYWFARNI